MKPTDDELAVFDQISQLGAALWAKSLETVGLGPDPKMFSCALFKRLWSNHRGFVVLWKNGLNLERDIILRSGIEAAICIAANYKLRADFISLLRKDAAFTVQGQIKLFRNEDDLEMVRAAEATLRDLQSRFPEGGKASKLDWKQLAEHGGVPQLYDWHRLLSGVSSHVTGLSILMGITTEGMAAKQKELNELTGKMRPMMMAGAMLQGCLQHAGMIDEAEDVETALTLVHHMNELSLKWPGVSE